jgi:hypothetical protein
VFPSGLQVQQVLACWLAALLKKELVHHNSKQVMQDDPKTLKEAQSPSVWPAAPTPILCSAWAVQQAQTGQQ